MPIMYLFFYYLLYFQTFDYTSTSGGYYDKGYNSVVSSFYTDSKCTKISSFNSLPVDGGGNHTFSSTCLTTGEDL